MVRVLVPVVLLSCCLSPLGLIAQTPDTATVHGHVTDQDHAVVAKARIKIVNRLSGLARMAETNASGEYSLAGLPVDGEYVVTADKAGFAQAQSSQVILAGGTTVQITSN